MNLQMSNETTTGSRPIPVFPNRESFKKTGPTEGDRLSRHRLRCYRCGHIVSYDEILQGLDGKKFTDGIEAFLEWLKATECSEHDEKQSFLRIKKDEANQPIAVEVVRCCPKAWYQFRQIFVRSFEGLIIGPKDAFVYWGFEVESLKESTLENS